MNQDNKPPKYIFRASGSGTVHIYSLENTVTGSKEYFDIVLQPSKTAVLTIKPENVTFTESIMGED